MLFCNLKNPFFYADNTVRSGCKTASTQNPRLLTRLAHKLRYFLILIRDKCQPRQFLKNDYNENDNSFCIWYYNYAIWARAIEEGVGYNSYDWVHTFFHQFQTRFQIFAFLTILDCLSEFWSKLCEIQVKFLYRNSQCLLVSGSLPS